MNLFMGHPWFRQHWLDCILHLHCGVMFITYKLEVIDCEVIEVCYVWIDP